MQDEQASRPAPPEQEHQGVGSKGVGQAGQVVPRASRTHSFRSSTLYLMEEKCNFVPTIL